MKNKLSTVSIVGNIALLAGLLWMRTDHEAELREIAEACMRGDELADLVIAESDELRSNVSTVEEKITREYEINVLAKAADVLERKLERVRKRLAEKRAEA